jgi:hypothetical protein
MSRSTLRRTTIAGLGFTAAAAIASAFAASTSTATAGGRPLSSDLTGAAEVPGPGDPDGTGVAEITVNPGLGVICYEITVADIDPATLAHIHFAPAGVAGPVVVNFSPPTTGSSSGCAEDVDRAIAKNILKNPDQYYVNVHNAAFPSGAVRGQLSK